MIYREITIKLKLPKDIYDKYKEHKICHKNEFNFTEIVVDFMRKKFREIESFEKWYETQKSKKGDKP